MLTYSAPLSKQRQPWMMKRGKVKLRENTSQANTGAFKSCVLLEFGQTRVAFNSRGPLQKGIKIKRMYMTALQSQRVASFLSSGGRPRLFDGRYFTVQCLVGGVKRLCSSHFGCQVRWSRASGLGLADEYRRHGKLLKTNLINRIIVCSLATMPETSNTAEPEKTIKLSLNDCSR